ncbi:MAG: methionine--tRNA ligase [Patescibacteria group bacterium]
MSKKFYITSPIFYPNGELHIGHAYTMVVCDIFARYHRLMEEDTYFLTGADENSAKIEKTAAARGVGVGPFLDDMTDQFKKLFADIGASYDQFIRTSDQKVHWPGAQAVWKRLVDVGDIYKSAYKGLYCPDCEAFYTEKDLVDGNCPFHHKPPQVIEEENYFFKLSKYTERIKKAIETGELEVMPVSRKNEILAQLGRGLDDVSFSRPAKTLGRGIPVPGDDSQIIYVWCDALVNYISALGYGTGNDELFKKFWPADVHVLGKDILRFHAAIWPGMLLSAGLPLPKRILVHGLIMSGGKKMSKSIGNTIDPKVLLDEYGKDAFRYYVARHIPLFDDGEMTMDIFKESYNAGLANGVGNLTNRIMKMAEMNLAEPVAIPKKSIPQNFKDAFESFDLNKAADIIWTEIGAMDLFIQENQPFKLIKEDKEKAIEIIKGLVVRLYTVGRMLNPILPETSDKIKAVVKKNKMPTEALFLRK